MIEALAVVGGAALVLLTITDLASSGRSDSTVRSWSADHDLAV